MTVSNKNCDPIISVMYNLYEKLEPVDETMSWSLTLNFLLSSIK